MDELQEIAQERDLVVVEDACEATGAEYRGKKVGAFGKAGVFAFYPNKQMTTGEARSSPPTTRRGRACSAACATRAVTRWEPGSAT